MPRFLTGRFRSVEVAIIVAARELAREKWWDVLMSASGTSRTWSRVRFGSALRSRADVARALQPPCRLRRIKPLPPGGIEVDETILTKYRMG